jgi:mono/diheme cytochrome c family protein
MRPRLALLLVLTLVAAVAAGCGGGEETAPLPEAGGTGAVDTGGAATEPADTGETDTGGTETGGTDTGGTDTGGGEGGEGDAEAGKEVFASAGCGSCHTLADAGASGSVGPSLDETQPDHALVVDRVTNGAGAMPAFKDQLSEQQIQDVAAYVSSVAGA